MRDHDPSEYAVAVIEFGGKDHLTDQILQEMCGAPAMVHAHYPQALIMLAIRGYDNDPRSLWDIPEVASYIRRFAREAKLTDWRSPLFQALEETSRGLLIACDAINKPHPFTLNIVPDKQ